MPKRLTSTDFIMRAKRVHGNRYDYSKSYYMGAHKKIKIICPVHGVFEQIASDHLAGKGCKECWYEKLKTNDTK